MLLAPSVYRTAAKESLSKAQKPSRVILIHTGAILLLSLLLAAFDYLLDQQISNTGGLSGLGMRSVLTTIQSVLRLAEIFALIFWQMGYTYYALQIARGKDAGIPSLFEGFRRFGPVLRLRLFTALLVTLAIFVSSYVASALFMFSPLSNAMMAELEPLIQPNMDEAAIMEVMLPLLEANAVPILILFGLCFLGCGLFLFCRYRLAEMWLLDHPDCGALAALRTSRKLMKGNAKAMLRIDLSYWWFYLLTLLVTALGLGDTILDSLGVELTMDAFTHYLVFFSLYAWSHMALYWWKQNQVSVTYAHAYLALCPQEETQETANV